MVGVSGLELPVNTNDEIAETDLPIFGKLSIYNIHKYNFELFFADIFLAMLGDVIYRNMVFYNIYVLFFIFICLYCPYLRFCHGKRVSSIF